MVEPTFRRDRITTQHSEFDHAVLFLPPTAASLIRDVIRPPLGEGSYDAFRETLIRRTKLEQRRLRQSLTSE